MNGPAPPPSAPPALTAPAQAQEGVEATRPSSVTAVDWADTAGPTHETHDPSPRPSTDSTPPRNRFSLDKFRRPVHPGHTDNEGAVGHQARMLYALITGLVPPPRPPVKKFSLPSLVPAHLSRDNGYTPVLVTQPSAAGAQVTPEHALGRRARAGDSPRPVPIVKPKALKKLKADLLDADKAKRIVSDLKRMDAPVDNPVLEADEQSSEPEPSSTLHVLASRGYALPPLDSTPTVSAVSLPPVSPGALAGLAGAQSGAFELLADMTGALIGKSGAHQGVFVPPVDRISVFVYWWGFELSIPPATIKTLSSVASVQQTFMTFLQAFVIAGGEIHDLSCRLDRSTSTDGTDQMTGFAGAPELAPFIRYIASYCDMEWSAIKAQDRGHGIVLAATWLLPVALVPRPWDFPVSLPSPHPPRKLGTT
ncbi:hypothetical protein JCM10049v2_006085 [Rhodotorula toruloides]